jgi:hypothetical protein
MSTEFKRSFMHPTRRKLADMVFTGEYDKSKQFAFPSETTDIHRNVGDVWVDDDGIRWEQKSFGRIRSNSISETMSEVRQYLSELGECKSSDCKTFEYTSVDKKLIGKTGFCLSCLTKREMQIKLDGLWTEYETYRMYSNMISHGIDILANLKQAYNDVKQEYEYINENGTTETWRMEMDADELRTQISQDMEIVQKELDEVIELRKIAWESLKDKNYDIVTPLNN